MRVEIFLKNGKKITQNFVYNIVEHDDMITIVYDRVGEKGDWTTCDMPDISFDKKDVDMLKVLMIDTDSEG